MKSILNGIYISVYIPMQALFTGPNILKHKQSRHVVIALPSGIQIQVSVWSDSCGRPVIKCVSSSLGSKIKCEITHVLVCREKKSAAVQRSQLSQVICYIAAALPGKDFLRERKHCVHSMRIFLYHDYNVWTRFASWHLFTDVKAETDVTWLLKPERIFHLATCSQ